MEFEWQSGKRVVRFASKPALMFLGIAAICSGCAFTSATIQIQPPKPTYVASVTGPEKVTVRLQVLDLRLTAGHPVLSRVVSHKINGFGGQGGEISNL
jgi:hypothetical protein